MSARASLILVVVVLLSGSGCQEPECSEQKPCAQGFSCSADGVCVSDHPDAGSNGDGTCPDTSVPTAPNVLHNPGAECGTSGWTPHLYSTVTLEAITAQPNSGTRALQITAGKSGDQHVWNDAQVTTQAGETWCAQAFMRGGTASDGRISVQRFVSGSGGGSFENYSSPVEKDQWVVVPPSKGLLKFTTAQAEELQLRITLQGAAAGETLIVDDVQLWKSADGSCTER